MGMSKIWPGVPPQTDFRQSTSCLSKYTVFDQPHIDLSSKFTYCLFCSPQEGRTITQFVDKHQVGTTYVELMCFHEQMVNKQTNT